MRKEVPKKNLSRPERLLRDIAWAVLVIGLFSVSNPATDPVQAKVGGFLVVALAVYLGATRNR